MQWLTVDELRDWCSENEDEATADILSAIGSAVELRIAQYLERPVVASEAELADNPTAVVADELIKLAAKQLVSHYNEHREAVTDTKATELPLGFGWMLSPYRLRTSF